MKNYDQSIEIIHSPNWSYILDHAHRILILVGSVSVKTNALSNLIKKQRPDMHKIYLNIQRYIRIKISIAY